jgi:CDGSH-type Zn-finger protein
VISGNIEVVSGTGRTINRVTKAVFCRCGNSASKPYCDGSHTKVGFKSE